MSLDTIQVRGFGLPLRRTGTMYGYIAYGVYLCCVHNHRRCPSGVRKTISSVARGRDRRVCKHANWGRLYPKKRSIIDLGFFLTVRSRLVSYPHCIPKNTCVAECIMFVVSGYTRELGFPGRRDFPTKSHTQPATAADRPGEFVC